MNKSQTIIQKFSTYIKVKPEGMNYFIPIYQTDLRLEKSISSHLKSDHHQREEDCIRYFLQVLKNSDYNNELAQQLVFCYLQTACWYAAQKVSRELSNTRSFNLSYSHEDCFMMACELALQPAKLLDHFDTNANASVQTYAQIVLARMIKNKIVGETKAKSLKFSAHGLLKNTSKSQLEQSLFAYGLSENETIKYCLVFQAFKDLYNYLFGINTTNIDKSKQDKIKSLNSEQCQVIADRVEQQSNRLQLPNKLLTEKQIKQILIFCVEAIRNYQNCQFVSLDSINKQVETRSNSLDLIAQAEEAKQFSQLKIMITDELSQLSWLQKTVILLWLGLDIKQIDLTQLLGVKQQFQVSRELKKILKVILKAIAEKLLSSEPNLTTKQINQLCNQNIQAIKDYLHYYSQQYFATILLQIINKHINNPHKLLTDKQQLKQVVNLFQLQVEESLNIELSRLTSAESKINHFVHNWLTNNQALLS